MHLRPSSGWYSTALKAKPFGHEFGLGGRLITRVLVAILLTPLPSKAFLHLSSTFMLSLIANAPLNHANAELTLQLTARRTTCFPVIKLLKYNAKFKLCLKMSLAVCETRSRFFFFFYQVMMKPSAHQWFRFIIWNKLQLSAMDPQKGNLELRGVLKRLWANETY